MTYKRLTERQGDEIVDKCKNCYYFDNPMGCTEHNCYEVMKERLAELEDKIEQGTLIELNDKLIGESVYGIQKDTAGKYWFDCDENTLLGFTTNGIVTWNDVHGYNDWFENGFWFFTREEAEKRLKELQNG